MQKTISDLTVLELKGLAYDELTRIEFAQNNIRALNQEINNRIQAQSQPTSAENFTSADFQSKTI